MHAIEHCYAFSVSSAQLSHHNSCCVVSQKVILCVLQLMRGFASFLDNHTLLWRTISPSPCPMPSYILYKASTKYIFAKKDTCFCPCEPAYPQWPFAGAALVPVLVFGENDIWHAHPVKTGILYKMQEAVKRLTFIVVHMLPCTLYHRAFCMLSLFPRNKTPSPGALLILFIFPLCIAHAAGMLALIIASGIGTHLCLMLVASSLCGSACYNTT